MLRSRSGLAAGVAASAALLLAAGCTTAIQHGLDEPAANEVMTALERAGIGAEKVAAEGAQTPGFTVRVAGADVPRALDVMRGAGLPRPHRQGLAEVYGQPSLVPTASEESARYLGALGGELERTLETVDGVVGARVHVVLPEADPLATDGKPRIAARAAVLLKIRGPRPPLGEADVQKLVAGSVPGLDAAAVSVVVTTAGEAPDGTPALAALGPLRLSAGSRSALIGVVLGALAAFALLAVLLLSLTRRLAAAQRAQG